VKQLRREYQDSIETELRRDTSNNEKILRKEKPSVVWQNGSDTRKAWLIKWIKYGFYGGGTIYLILSILSGDISEKVSAESVAYAIGYFGAGTLTSVAGGLVVGITVGYVTSIFLRKTGEPTRG